MPLRVLHINLMRCGLGRYGLLYGKALSASRDIESLSVFDSRLLDIPFLREHAKGVKYRVVNWAGSPLDKANALQGLRKIIKEFNPNVIHDSSSAYSRNVVIWPLLLRWAPLVVTEHDPEPHVGMSFNPGHRLAKWLLKRLASHIFVHGPSCKQSLVDQGLPRERISIIQHGHLGMFDRGRHTQVVRDDKEVLFFGQMRYNKGVDFLPRIAQRVSKVVPDVKFVVAGSTKGLRYSEDYAADAVRTALHQMKQEPNFEVHDRFIPDEEVEYFFKRAGLTLLPYREATQSGVLMIAMPLQSVAVVTSVGDMPHVVRHGETGFVCQPNVESISAQLIELLQHPERTTLVRETASRFASNEAGWDSVVNRTTDVYRRITGSSENGTPLGLNGKRQNSAPRGVSATVESP